MYFCRKASVLRLPGMPLVDGTRHFLELSTPTRDGFRPVHRLRPRAQTGHLPGRFFGTDKLGFIVSRADIAAFSTAAVVRTAQQVLGTPVGKGASPWSRSTTC